MMLHLGLAEKYRSMHWQKLIDLKLGEIKKEALKSFFAYSYFINIFI